MLSSSTMMSVQTAHSSSLNCIGTLGYVLSFMYQTFELLHTRTKQRDMEIVTQMRASRKNTTNAILLIATVFRERLWDSVDFRTENGITELFVLLQRCGVANPAAMPSDVNLFSMCRDISTRHRNYVTSNERIQMVLSSMILDLAAMHILGTCEGKGGVLLNVLRGTLVDAIVPFCLFIHQNMREDAISEIRNVLSVVVFPGGCNVLQQWPMWNETEPDAPRTDSTCPITLDRIVDGAIASDGHLYERSAILTHMIEKRDSPMTREWLDTDFVHWQA
jgi:hypothetical protein